MFIRQLNIIRSFIDYIIDQFHYSVNIETQTDGIEDDGTETKNGISTPRPDSGFAGEENESKDESEV